MNKETMDKITKTVEYLIAPLTAVLGIWNIDAGVYVAAGAGVVVSVLAFVKLFIKE